MGKVSELAVLANSSNADGTVTDAFMRNLNAMVTIIVLIYRTNKVWSLSWFLCFTNFFSLSGCSVTSKAGIIVGGIIGGIAGIIILLACLCCCCKCCCCRKRKHRKHKNSDSYQYQQVPPHLPGPSGYQRPPVKGKDLHNSNFGNQVVMPPSAPLRHAAYPSYGIAQPGSSGGYQNPGFSAPPPGFISSQEPPPPYTPHAGYQAQPEPPAAYPQKH